MSNDFEKVSNELNVFRCLLALWDGFDCASDSNSRLSSQSNGVIGLALEDIKSFQNLVFSSLLVEKQYESYHQIIQNALQKSSAVSQGDEDQVFAYNMEEIILA